MITLSYKVGVILYLSMCSLATFSQFMILIFFIKYIKLSQNFACRLIVGICLIDVITWTIQLFLCIFTLATKTTIHQISNGFCVTLGITSNFFMVLTITFMLLIPLSIYIQIIYRSNPARYEKPFYIYSIIYSIIFSVLPICFNRDAYSELEKLDFRCWIKGANLRVLAVYAHLWIAFLLSLFFLIKVLTTLNQEIFKDLEKTLIKKLSWIPVFSTIIWFVPSVYRVIYKLQNDEYDLDSDLLFFSIIPFQGFINSIIFGNINEEVKKKIKAFFCCNMKELKINKSFVDDENVLRPSDSLKSKNRNSSFEFRLSSDIDGNMNRTLSTFEIQTGSKFTNTK